MTHRPDIDRVLETWMNDGPNAISDRVVDVVAARIGVQRQRRAWPFQRRTSAMTPLKIAVGLAAALILAVVGYTLLPKGPSIGGPSTASPTTAPTPSAQPTAAVTAAASASAVFPPWWTSDGGPTAGGGAGVLQAGSQTTRSFRPGFTFSVPEGWVNDGDEAGYFSLFPDTPANQAEFARSERVAQSIVMGPHDSPWFFCDSVEDNRGATAAEIAGAVAANEALATTGLIDVAIGGLTGKQFDVRLNPDWTGTCPPSPDDPPGLNLADERIRGILLDVPDRGVYVMFVSSITSADYEAFLAEAMPIVESFKFDLGQ
jgi:hypothetical protein